MTSGGHEAPGIVANVRQSSMGASKATLNFKDDASYTGTWSTWLHTHPNSLRVDCCKILDVEFSHLFTRHDSWQEELWMGSVMDMASRLHVTHAVSSGSGIFFCSTNGQ